MTNLFTHGDQPMHRCRSCDASTATIQALRAELAAKDAKLEHQRTIIAEQGRRILLDAQRHAEYQDQMQRCFTSMQQTIASMTGVRT